MTRGEATQIKVHFKGKEDDFIIFLDDMETFEKWKKDKSTPLAQVVNSFKVFITHKQGVTGTLDEASKSQLDNQFGSHVDDEVVRAILEQGEVQVTESRAREGSKNDARGTHAR